MDIGEGGGGRGEGEGEGDGSQLQKLKLNWPYYEHYGKCALTVFGFSKLINYVQGIHNWSQFGVKLHVFIYTFQSSPLIQFFPF